MTPSSLSKVLLSIAKKIEASQSPDKNLVASDLRHVLAGLKTAASSELADQILEGVHMTLEDQRGDWFEKADGVEWSGVIKNGLIKMESEEMQQTRLFKISVTEVPEPDFKSSYREFTGESDE